MKHWRARIVAGFCASLVLPAMVLAQELDLRAQLLAELATGQLGGAGTRPIAGTNAFSLQMPESPASHQRPFSFGNRLFNTNWVEAPGSVAAFDGLGPLFNRVSCSGCHTLDGRGRPPASGQGPMESMLLRLSVAGKTAEGGPLPHPVYGDQLSERASPGHKAEGRAQILYTDQPGFYGDGSAYTLTMPQYSIVEPGYGPLDDVMISPRVAPHMVGLGLLEAVPDATLAILADPEDTDRDGISGRVNIVWDVAKKAPAVGRFGWKANQPSLRQQNAAAAAGDIGLVTTLFPKDSCTAAQSPCQVAISGGAPEISDVFLDKLTLYTQSLAVPAQRGASSPEVTQGAALFRSMGCAGCHMPTLKTGSVVALPELANQIFHPYTDLLLHDMGDGLADNRPDFAASGTEWRTPPLWGLGLVETINGHTRLLHDGRARDFAEAILWHGGEATSSREAFRTAPKEQRDALIAFLKSL